MSIVIRLTEMPQDTNFAPLGVLGYCLTRTQFLAPVWADLQLPLKTVDHAPEAKLLDVVISILTGCRALAQVNTRLRPDLALARAWGRERFADQSTLMRTLDAFWPEHVAHLRQGSEALFRRESRVLRHDFAAQWLWLDIDLTPLPASKHAEGSTKGKLGKKTAMAANWRGSMLPSTTRHCSRGYTLASKTAARPIFPSWRPWSPAWGSRSGRNSAPCCARTRGLAAMPTSTMPLANTGTSWPRAKAVGVPKPMRGKWSLRPGRTSVRTGGPRPPSRRRSTCARRNTWCYAGRRRRA